MLETCLEAGIAIVTNGGAANPTAAALGIVEAA
ncbi:hypothetical protein ACTXP8_27690 [Klebsiella pneumoniae]